MAPIRQSIPPSCFSFRSCFQECFKSSKRWQSTATTIAAPSSAIPVTASSTTSIATPVQATSALKRLTAWHLMRNIILSAVLTRPLIYKPALATVQKIANSNSRFLNPDNNPVLRAWLKPLLYDHFCAGVNKQEIASTTNQVRKLGFAGVILCYGKEIQLSADNNAIGEQGSREAQFIAWRDGTLETLDMVDENNWIGIKFTGAGLNITESLVKAEKWPPAFEEAIYAICDKAKTRKCRIWIDAEQQAVQKGIDRWTIDLMRKYNQNGEVLIYNTIQAYLKESRTKLTNQLTLASEEGWDLAIKLVRGAYIANDKRSLIHDTKTETDNCYNSIVNDLMHGKLPGFSQDKFPFMRLFLAGHNSESVNRALKLGHELAAKGELKVNPEFGQLQGMADDVGCDIIHFRETKCNSQPQTVNDLNTFSPQVFKCLTWGSIQECIQYLVRRAIENSAAVERMRATAMASKQELYRRLTPAMLRRG